MRGRFPSGAPGRQPQPIPYRLLALRECIRLDAAEAADSMRRLAFEVQALGIELELMLDSDPYLIEPPEA